MSILDQKSHDHIEEMVNIRYAVEQLTEKIADHFDEMVEEDMIESYNIDSRQYSFDIYLYEGQWIRNMIKATKGVLEGDIKIRTTILSKEMMKRIELYVRKGSFLFDQVESLSLGGVKMSIKNR